MRAGGGILAVTGSIDPEPLTAIIFNLKIVAHGDQFGIAFPPFSKDAFRPVCPLNAPTLPAPGEGDGWVIGQERHGLYGLG